MNCRRMGVDQIEEYHQRFFKKVIHNPPQVPLPTRQQKTPTMTRHTTQFGTAE